MPKGVYIRTEECNEAHKGILRSEEYKQKMSKAQKGKHHSPETEFKKGNPSPMKGKHLSKEMKKKISDTHKGKSVGKNNSMFGIHLYGEKSSMFGKIGEQNPNWKGGIKLSRKKQNNKRRRNLDFIPLNEFFEGAVAHHLDKVYVIYMDRAMHQNIRHSVLKNINMDTINAVAWNYL